MSTEDLFCDLPSGIRICYRLDGPANGRPVLLIAGLALDLTSWSPALIEALVNAGYRVVTFDNRDSGRSTHVDTPPPGVLQQVFARTRAEDYDIADLANDALGLMNALGADTFDVVGMSMGGMIAQTLAALHPERVRSLTSIISTTGERGVGRPALSTMLRMTRRAPRTLEEYKQRHLDAVRRLGSPAFPVDPEAEFARASVVWERGGGLAASPGSARQITAIQKSDDRSEQVKRITAPTLVIHGERDVMVHPSGGKATADAIPGARLVTLPDMRHGIPDDLIPQLAPLLLEHLKAAQPVR